VSKEVSISASSHRCQSFDKNGDDLWHPLANMTLLVVASASHHTVTQYLYAPMILLLLSTDSAVGT